MTSRQRITAWAVITEGHVQAGDKLVCKVDIMTNVAKRGLGSVTRYVVLAGYQV